ncbi:MAG: response regulator, partial [Myxococcales bacterium]|nr:response regulator [Myxococcales bacterium]
MGVRPRILVADDDAALLDDVASVLESVGEVTRAASGAELIEHLGEDGPYDLIVTDIAMPWMTGVQAVQ